MNRYESLFPAFRLQIFKRELQKCPNKIQVERMIKEYPLNSWSLMVKRMEFSKSSSVAAFKDQVTGGKEEGVFVLIYPGLL